ncbi:unnamed protein product [Dovyalis caffra]|uniref:Uncharacterized protein n=1 Tax=Dovyalis caffra TaxID=77055 RepID=A0AAV1RX37_9ROSI|nr:unnamed protein product [Dovyalis caffra]
MAISSIMKKEKEKETEDVSDAQWRNFRANLLILTLVFAIFALFANSLRALFSLKAKGMSLVWLFISLAYLSYLHGACFGYDYHWAHQDPIFDQQERSGQKDKFSFSIYLSYLLYAPVYIAGPIISFNAFASQLDMPQNNYTVRDVSCGLWKLLSPMDIFIIGYGVLNFMWLKFSLIWRYFRFWSLICGIEAPENMPRYLYIPLGGSRRKLLNIWVIFTFVAIWHDLEWKLLSWAWLTCLFFIPEMVVKSAANTLKVESAFGEFLFRELSAAAGAITITCLMVANLVGYVIGPSGINWLLSQFLTRQGLPVMGGMFITFYVGTKLMFHIDDAKQRKR